VVVDPAGRGDCTTILEALALLPAAGGTIRLADGTHTLAGQVGFTSKTNITIEGGRAAIVDCAAVAGNNSGFLFQFCTNITLRGFTFARAAALSGGGFIGITKDNSFLQFLDLYFDATSGCTGVYGVFDVVSNVLIRGCTFKTVASPGMYLYAFGGNGSRFRIEENEFSTSSNGIQMEGGPSGVMTGIDIVGNTFTGNSKATVLQDYCTYVTFVSNTVLGGGVGFEASDNTSSYVNVTGNNFSGQSAYSIVITATPYVSISGNSISNSVGGINTSGTYGTIVGNSLITINTNTPAIYVRGAYNIVSQNMLYNLSGKGIDINNVTDTVVEGNVIQSTSSYAIYPHGSARTTIIGNKIYTAGAHAILMDTCAGSKINDNFIYATQGGDRGIYLTASSNTTISGNTCLSCTGLGILVNASSLVHVEGNTCLSNTGPGISLTDADNCDIVSNLCSANSTYGISEDAASTGNNFSGNRLTTNTTARLLISAGKVLYQDGVGSIKATGTTADAYVTIFDFAASNAGLCGCFRVFNTDAANTLTYQITFTGMNGSSQVQSADIAPLANVLFDAHTDQGTALVPFNGIKVELKSKVGGSHATYGVYAALPGAEV
jgi:parallel beta-helix repeat protein